MSFFNLTLKSLERSRWCNSAVFIGSFDDALRITYCWLRRLHCIYLEQNSIEKGPKSFEASGFPCCILNNTQFVTTSHEIKKRSEKVGTSANKMLYANYTFLWWRSCIRSIRTTAYVVDKQSGICRRYLLLQVCVPSVKTATNACNRIKMDFFFQI